MPRVKDIKELEREMNKKAEEIRSLRREIAKKKRQEKAKRIKELGEYIDKIYPPEASVEDIIKSLKINLGHSLESSKASLKSSKAKPAMSTVVCADNSVS